MSKNVRWQIPFCSLKGIQYRIDIYDEGYNRAPVVLTAGATPFVTDESNSDDFFEAIRSQSGTISVIDTDGALMEQIIPEDNVSRPVRMLRVIDSKVLWQGFVSPEVYSQGFTDTAQEINIPVLSMLEAMDSIIIPEEEAINVVYIQDALGIAFSKLQSDAGISFIENIYFPRASRSILERMVDMTAFFHVESISSEQSNEFILQGKSCKSIVESVCTFMGWTVRESGCDIFFTEPSSNIGWYRIPYSSFVDRESRHTKGTKVEITTVRIEDLEWRGIGHKINVRNGARSVKVSCSLKSYKPEPELPNTPTGDATSRESEYSIDDKTHYYYISLSNTTNAFNTVTQSFHKSGWGAWSDSSSSELLQALAPRGQKSSNTYYNFSGSFLARFYDGDEATTAPNTQDGLMLYFSSGTGTGYSKGDVFSMRGVMPLRGVDGSYIIINPSIYAILSPGGIMRKLDDLADPYIYVFVRVGERYWNGSDWQDTKCYFKLQYDENGVKSNWDKKMNVKEQVGYYIPVDKGLKGTLEFGIQDNTIGNSTFYAAFMDNIEVHHIFRYDNTSDGKKNDYYIKLDTHFSEDIKINNDLSSNLSNLPSPSLLMDSESTYMRTITYENQDGSQGSTQRPERNLLDRLASYYAKRRKSITIEVERPNDVLPLTNVSGFDGKLYIPLCESRDWQTDVSTIQCFETAD